MPPSVAVASASQIAADAGGRVAQEGGNAVDAAVAAALVTAVTEPGVCGLGCGGYVTAWPLDGDPVTLDGNIEMPGRGAPRTRFGAGGREIEMEYGGGVRTIVGPGSVGTPGALSALGIASERFGSVPWATVVQPAIDCTREGFLLPQACYNYLIHSGDVIFAHSPDGRRALYRPSGELKQAGELVEFEGLADSLEAIARNGVDEFYRGDLGRRIADEVYDNGGILTQKDLAAYETIVRPALTEQLRDWTVATNPPPAIGGAMLAAMLLLIDARPPARWARDEVAHLIDVQEAVWRYRLDKLDLSEDRKADTEALLELAAAHDVDGFRRSASTVHSSAVDSDGLACAITLSAGYGSGVIPPGTGILLNNCLGEIELNRRGLIAGPPGTRLPSNMAPTVAKRSDGAVLAIGSPGADRITTAILQTLVNFVYLGMPLESAIEHPRAHVEFDGDEMQVAFEQGLPVEELAVSQRRFGEKSMFFGGVGAALWHHGDGFTVAADGRRTGGTVLVRNE